MTTVAARVTQNNFPRIRAAFPRAVHDIMSKGTHDVYAKSQITVPVRRNQRKIRGGALKASGQVEYDEGSYTGTIGYHIYYAIYVHEGTRRMPARPFLENALNDTKPAVLAAFGSLESRLS